MYMSALSSSILEVETAILSKKIGKTAELIEEKSIVKHFGLPYPRERDLFWRFQMNFVPLNKNELQ